MDRLSRRRIIDFIFELLFQLIWDILWQIAFEVVTGLGWESMRESMGRERQTSPVVAAIGHFLMGLIAGVVSIAVLPTRLIGRGGFRGISLFLSPLGTGLAMHALGDFWREHGSEPSALFTFRGGAAFAFGMALVRFVYVERMFF